MVEPVSTGALMAYGGMMAGGNAISSYINQKSANSASKKAALTQFLYNNMLMDRQIEWEKERATHAHQWEMQDLKAAGLNPALTATGGSGATTGSISAPTNAMPNMQGLNMANMGDILGQVINLKNQTEATNASNANQFSQAIFNIANAKNIPIQNKLKAFELLIKDYEAQTSRTNAITNKTRNNAGAWAQLFGAENAEEITKSMRNSVQRPEGDWFHFEVKRRK